MGLTHSSTGKCAVDEGFEVKKRHPSDFIIALAGNPNVGKSTVFNGLTGMNQHTGNWPGKTVANATGYAQSHNNGYVLVDIPGTYSLRAHSKEEEIARNFIIFGNADATIVVCDATCLERNLNLVLQAIEIGKPVFVCLNLLDEAKKKGISIDTQLLSKMLGVKVITTVARKKKSLSAVLNTLDCADWGVSPKNTLFYEIPIETAIKIISDALPPEVKRKINPRWLSLQLIEPDDALLSEISTFLGFDIMENDEIFAAAEEARRLLTDSGFSQHSLRDSIVSSALDRAQKIAGACVKFENAGYNRLDRRLDKILTSKRFGYPVMLLLLAVVFYITISGANYPSAAISSLLSSLGEAARMLFKNIGMPEVLQSFLLNGVWQVLSSVVAVMLPPMAIFFPLFTLLEDSGYLPRIAYNLDRPFRSCCACGKQSLTMCMGFGCNAAGVVGCRIIDSPRERMLAILTNNFVPCNGRFPTLIALISMFFISGEALFKGVASALILTGIILLCIGMTLLVTRLLSSTILKGMPSSFTLELPSYRKPQIMRVIVRSVFDRTLFVLGRAVCVAIPAGMIIWLLANISAGGVSLLSRFCAFLDPFARLCGLDGAIFASFILGFPANEIVMPLIIMAYMSQGSLTEISLSQMKALFVSNGWTRTTAVCMIIFCLMHWPCSTTVLTVKKETGSIKWALLSMLIPTVCGIILCMLVNGISHLL